MPLVGVCLDSARRLTGRQVDVAILDLMTPLAVVICTLNRRESCIRTLESLRHQTAGAFSVQVVDNGGDDGTADAVRGLIDGYPVPLSVVTETQRGLSAARNRGAAECLRAHGGTADDLVFVFLDDDTVAVPGLVEAYRKAFEGGDFAAAGGRILPWRVDGLDPVLLPFLNLPCGGPSANFDLGSKPMELNGTGDCPTPFGGNMALRASHFQALGGFREDLGWGCDGNLPSEETELFHRLLANCDRIVYVPEATVEHCIQVEKLTREYFLNWFAKQGEASAVILRSRKNFVGRTLSATELVARKVVYRLRASTAGTEEARFRVECKQSRASGKLRSLLRSSGKTETPSV